MEQTNTTAVTIEQERDTSDAAEAYFQPLGIKESFRRVAHVFRERWRHLLAVTAVPIFVWYAAAVGIRKGFGALSSSSFVTIKSLYLGNGTEISYGWETHRATLSRLGLAAEFVLFSFLFLLADAANIRTVADLYAGRDADVRKALRAVLSKLPSLLTVCAVWSAVLVLPLLLIVLCMAPESEKSVDGINVYYQPWLRLVLGLLYFIASSAFIMATYLSHSILIVEGGRAIPSLKDSFESFKNSWSHFGAVLALWFLTKIVITKFVMALNYWYYMHDRRVWAAWDLPGIPLHPVRVLWSASDDLWRIGRSWISPPFVVFLAAAGSVFRAVLYLDARVKRGGYTRDSLRDELGANDGEETADYKSMGNEGQQVV